MPQRTLPNASSCNWCWTGSRHQLHTLYAASLTQTDTWGIRWGFDKARFLPFRIFIHWGGDRWLAVFHLGAVYWLYGLFAELCWPIFTWIRSISLKGRGGFSGTLSMNPVNGGFFWMFDDGCIKDEAIERDKHVPIVVFARRLWINKKANESKAPSNTYVSCQSIWCGCVHPSLLGRDSILRDWPHQVATCWSFGLQPPNDWTRCSVPGSFHSFFRSPVDLPVFLTRWRFSYF